MFYRFTHFYWVVWGKFAQTQKKSEVKSEAKRRLFFSSNRNEIPLPELSEEDICTIEELIQSNDESFAKIAQNIKNMVISSE